MQFWLYPLIWYQKIVNVWTRWRLRRHGIDPDEIPEIKELRRRYQAGEPLRPDNLSPPTSP